MHKKSLTKADIIDTIYEKTDYSRLTVKHMVETLLDLMKGAVKRDNTLLISGFGRFEVCPKKKRKGRNPQTRKPITLAPRKVVVFRLSKKFRDKLNPQ